MKFHNGDIVYSDWPETHRNVQAVVIDDAGFDITIKYPDGLTVHCMDTYGLVHADKHQIRLHKINALAEKLLSKTGPRAAALP